MRTGGWFSVGRQSCRECRNCGGLVYWRTSKRTGRDYPARVQGVNSENALRAEALVWVTHEPHRCPAPHDTVGTLAKQIADQVANMQACVDLLVEHRMTHHVVRGMLTSLGLDWENEAKAKLRLAYDSATVEAAWDKFLAS